MSEPDRNWHPNGDGAVRCLRLLQLHAYETGTWVVRQAHGTTIASGNVDKLDSRRETLINAQKAADGAAASWLYQDIETLKGGAQP